MTVNPVEAAWLLINLFAAFVTFLNLIDAYQGWRAVAGTSPAWRVQARANVRREVVSLVIVAGLLVIVLPSLTRPGDVELSLLLLVFMAVPVGMALNSYLDARTRRTLAALVAEAQLP